MANQPSEFILRDVGKVRNISAVLAEFRGCEYLILENVEAGMFKSVVMSHCGDCRNRIHYREARKE